MGFLRLPMHVLHVPVKFTVSSKDSATDFTHQVAARHVLKRLLGHRWGFRDSIWSRADGEVVTEKGISKHKLTSNLERACSLLKGVWLHAGYHKEKEG
jgi:hypothetical protein